MSEMKNERCDLLFDAILSLKTRGKGKNADDDSVGIGLALSKAIIEKSGGTVSVDSEIGIGSTFIIKIFHLEK